MEIVNIDGENLDIFLTFWEFEVTYDNIKSHRKIRASPAL